MERKENLNEPKGTATAAASKKAPARKQSGSEASPSPAPDTTPQKEQDLLQTASQAGGEIVNQVQQRAGSIFTRQKETAATELSQVVQAVRQFGQQLTQGEGGPVHGYVK